jgi:pimeloyl-ACP methyl ester carboxylesterase
MILNSLKTGLVSAAVLITVAGMAAPALAAPPIKNIVLVHGAFVDGSGWQSVYDILIKDGFHVSLVQQPLTSLEGDVAAAKRILNLQDGPCVLAGHSYGGAVITEAGTDPHVAALVYIAAHAPDNSLWMARRTQCGIRDLPEDVPKRLGAQAKMRRKPC